MAICQCDNWMAAKFDTYLAEYQHGLCFSFVRGVSFTGQSKNFPSEKAVDGERQIIIKNYAIQSSHVHTDLGKVHAHHPGAISSMTHKMMSDALLLPPSIPASFSAKGTVVILTKEQNTLVRKGHV